MNQNLPNFGQKQSVCSEIHRKRRLQEVGQLQLKGLSPRMLKGIREQEQIRFPTVQPVRQTSMEGILQLSDSIENFPTRNETRKLDAAIHSIDL